MRLYEVLHFTIRERQSLHSGLKDLQALQLLWISRTWPCGVEFKVVGAQFHIPAAAYLFHFFAVFFFRGQNCRRIFVMVLKGLSASKLRELVVQPISETTQSFQLWREWVGACGRNSSAKLSIQSFNMKLGEVNLHFATDVSFNPPKTTSSTSWTSLGRALVSC